MYYYGYATLIATLVRRLNPSNANDAILVWGDVTGSVNAINFSSATIALFERPAAPAGGKQGEGRMERDSIRAFYSKYLLICCDKQFDAIRSKLVWLSKKNGHITAQVLCCTYCGRPIVSAN